MQAISSASPAREPESLRTDDDYSRIRTDVRNRLLAARNSDGGWGYASGRRSRIEPTCWAILALGHSAGQSPAIAPLRAWNRQAGWLVDVPGVPPNTAFNALAALTLLQDASSATLAYAIADRLIQTKGLALEQTDVVRQDGSLQAWPWVAETASWVEPTAWSLLLLKKVGFRSVGAEAAERIRVGEQFLFDRACYDGGWNYGNKEVFGTKLWPYVPTTALALLALRDHRDHPVVVRSLEQLHKDVASERSVVAIALTIICLRAYGAATDALEEAIVKLWAHADPENLLGAAMMLYALTDATEQVVFKV